MKRGHYLLTVALSLAAGFAGHALSGGLPAAATRPAEARAPRASEWEYCAVVKAQAGDPRRQIYWINFFKGEGVKTEPVEANLGGNSFAKAVARLGEEGWEMVGEGPLEVLPVVRPGPVIGVPTAIFFKRRME
ncbi:MAG TPA: hypothetical protein VF588_11025 [Pyrinomonadaceae bacterium]|jgi:hypothetical protein